MLIAAIFLPLVGAVWIWVIADRGHVAIRQSALVSSLLTALLAGWVVFHYEPVVPGEAFASLTLPWISASSPIKVQFAVGLDGVSLWMFGLSALLCVTAILVSWETITDRPAAFYGLLLLLEMGMLGVFAARDILLFYIFFEFTLIPLFFLIGVWGSEDRRYAASKFFIYTLAGSLLTFLGLLAIVLWDFSHGGGASVNPDVPAQLTFFIPELVRNLQYHPMPFELQLLIFVALFAGFAIKVPLFPLHTWLPLAHVQAPTAGSVILAGVLLKIGTYGFLRFSIPMLPEATAACVPALLWLSAAGIIYGALVALAQTDIKRLIAYSSVSHMGYCMLGIFSLTKFGMDGGVLQMVNHGLATGGLFAIVGMIYERYHTREISQLGGLTKRMPLLSVFLLIFVMSSIGLPGLNGFAGEFLILTGMFQRAQAESPVGYHWQFLEIAALAVFGVVLGAWYMLWLVERTFFGPLKEPHHGDDHHGEHPIRDMNFREVAALAPLVVLMVWIGLYPQFFIERMTSSLDPLTTRAESNFEKYYHMDESHGTAETDKRAAPAVAQVPVSADKPVTIDGHPRKNLPNSTASAAHLPLQP
jgi:NADH-quinone oxidoreductase subunit M